MDRLSFIGLALAIIAILGGQYIEGGSLSGLMDAPAALIVFGGTIGAVMLQSSAKTHTWGEREREREREGGRERERGWGRQTEKKTEREQEKEKERER